MTEVKASRREKSLATRNGILAAAHVEFAERGFHGATMAAIAKRAGVASQTVYFVFHTKAALISALIDQLVVGAAEQGVPQDAAWWSAMNDEPDAAIALQHFVRGAAPLFERASFISEVLRAAALTDDEVRKTHQAHESLRAGAFREVVAGLAAKGSLRAGHTVDTATDVLLVTFSDAAYVLFVERGWTPDQIVEHFSNVLPRVLLE